ALHAAFLNGGIFVYVPKDVQIDTPLQALYWQEDVNAALFNHVIVVAEENSEVTFVENYISDTDEETVANIITEVYAHDNAKVQFGAVDHLSSSTTSYIKRYGDAGKYAEINWALGQMNEGNTVSENTTYLEGDDSVTNLKTVTVGRGKQTQNFTATTLHGGLNTDGQILQR